MITVVVGSHRASITTDQPPDEELLWLLWTIEVNN